jgi:hypothetical protein
MYLEVEWFMNWCLNTRYTHKNMDIGRYIPGDDWLDGHSSTPKARWHQTRILRSSSLGEESPV